MVLSILMAFFFTAFEQISHCPHVGAAHRVRRPLFSRPEVMLG